MSESEASDPSDFCKAAVNPYSAESGNFQTEQRSETDGDEWDRSFTAAATVGAIEAIVVWVLTAAVWGFTSGTGSSRAGIKAAAEAFIAGSASAILLFIPIGLCGAVAGMCLNLFLRRCGMPFVWALGFVFFIVWFAVFQELADWD
jgi:hypothetical protein